MTSIPQACAQGELAHLASAFDNAVVGLALVSPDDSWLAVNRALCEFLGYSEEQLMELPVNQLVHSEELEESRQRALILGHDKNSYRREKRYLHKDGYVQWADFSCTLVRDAMGQPLHYLVQVQDITERKLAEQALRTTEERLRGLVALSSDWYWEQDEQFRFLRFFSNDELSRWCPDYYRLLGRACWEIPGLRPVGTTWEGHLATLQAHRPFRDIEYVDASDPQQPRYLLVSGEPIFDESGRFTGYRGVAHDVSESRIVTQQLAHAQSLLHIAAQLGRLGAWALDAGDSRLTWSDEVCAASVARQASRPHCAK